MDKEEPDSFYIEEYIELLHKHIERLETELDFKNNLIKENKDYLGTILVNLKYTSQSSNIAYNDICQLKSLNRCYNGAIEHLAISSRKKYVDSSLKAKSDKLLQFFKAWYKSTKINNK